MQSKEDALRATARYNNVALDGKPMKIEVVAAGTAVVATLSSGISVTRTDQRGARGSSGGAPSGSGAGGYGSSGSGGRGGRLFQQAVRGGGRGGGGYGGPSRVPNRMRSTVVGKNLAQLDADMEDYMQG